MLLQYFAPSFIAAVQAGAQNVMINRYAHPFTHSPPPRLMTDLTVTQRFDQRHSGAFLRAVPQPLSQGELGLRGLCRDGLERHREAGLLPPRRRRQQGGTTKRNATQHMLLPHRSAVVALPCSPTNAGHQDGPLGWRRHEHGPFGRSTIGWILLINGLIWVASWPWLGCDRTIRSRTTCSRWRRRTRRSGPSWTSPRSAFSRSSTTWVCSPTPSPPTSPTPTSPPYAFLPS